MRITPIAPPSTAGAASPALLSLLLFATLLAAALAGRTAHAAGLLEIYRQAQSGDPVLRQAAAERLADRESKPQARALWLPRIDAGASLLRNFDVEPTSPGQDNSFTSRSVDVSLRQTLYDRASWARLGLADAVLEQADAVFSSAEDSLILRVADAYFNVLSAGQDLAFTLAEKDAIARQLEQAKQRFEVGLITITAVQEAQARFDSVTADEIAARAALADRKEGLRQITGDYYDELEELRAKMPLEPPTPADADAWVEMALNSNPALQSARAGVAIADRNLDIQRAGHYPSVALVAGYDDSRRDNVDSGGGQIGLQVSVPLFEGFAVNSRTREAAFQLEAAKEAREGQLRSITTQVRNAYRGVTASISQVTALDQARTSTRSALEATQAGFDVGTRTIVDVLNAQRDVFLAQRNYANARYLYVLNLLALKQAAGVIDIADVEMIERWLTPPDKKN